MRRIVIEDATSQPERVPAPKPARLDVQDGLLIMGIGCWEAAAIVIWWPAALILAGLFCLGFAFLIERATKNGTAKS